VKAMKRYTIDRIEDGFAVCEDENGAHERFPASVMPEGAREGDCLRFIRGRFFIDGAETRRRREYIRLLSRKVGNAGGKTPEKQR